jgi:hypothetical protein
VKYDFPFNIDDLHNNLLATWSNSVHIIYKQIDGWLSCSSTVLHLLHGNLVDPAFRVLAQESGLLFA